MTSPRRFMISSSNPKGLRTNVSRRSSDTGDSPDTSVKNATKIMAFHKTGRQRGEGSLPVGNSRSRNTTIRNQPIPRAEPRRPRPGRDRTGSSDQRVYAVFQRQLSQNPDERTGAEYPADRVLGTARCNERADRREREDQQRDDRRVP